MYNDSINEHYQDLLLLLLDRCSCYSSIRLNRKNDKMLPLPVLSAMNGNLSHSNNYTRYVSNLPMNHKIQLL